MKTLQFLFGKLLKSVVMAAFVTALSLGWQVVREPRDEERLASLRAELAEKQSELARIDEEIAQKESLSKWDLLKRGKIKRLEVYDRPKLQLDITCLQGEIELQRGHSYIELFLKKCCESGVRVFCYSLAFFLILPLAFSLFMYYGIAAWVERCKHKKRGENKSSQQVDILVKKSSLDVLLAKQERLYFRGNWVGERSGVNAKTKMMWRWRSPLITFAAELFELKVFGCVGNEEGKIKITAPEADLYIGQLKLKDGASIIISPRHLIGVSDGIQIRTRWNLNMHSLLAGRVRQVVFCGPGRLFVYGFQGINHEIIGANGCKIEINRLIGYDLQSMYSLCRTETWWHYFRSEADLFDVKVENGLFIRQTASGVYRSPDEHLAEKAINCILNGIGRVFGF